MCVEGLEVVGAQAAQGDVAEGGCDVDADGGFVAGVGVGAYDSVQEACEATIQITGKTSPTDRTSQVYSDYYMRYQALYPALEKEFKQIAKVAT